MGKFHHNLIAKNSLHGTKHKPIPVPCFTNKTSQTERLRNSNEWNIFFLSLHPILTEGGRKIFKRNPSLTFIFIFIVERSNQFSEIFKKFIDLYRKPPKQWVKWMNPMN